VSIDKSTNKLQLAVLRTNGVFLLTRKLGYYFSRGGTRMDCCEAVYSDGHESLLKRGIELSFERDSGKLAFSVAGAKTTHTIRLQEVGRGIGDNQVRNTSLRRLMKVSSGRYCE